MRAQSGFFPWHTGVIGLFHRLPNAQIVFPPAYGGYRQSPQARSTCRGSSPGIRGVMCQYMETAFNERPRHTRDYGHRKQIVSILRSSKAPRACFTISGWSRESPRSLAGFGYTCRLPGNRRALPRSSLWRWRSAPGACISFGVFAEKKAGRPETLWQRCIFDAAPLRIGLRL